MNIKRKGIRRKKDSALTVKRVTTKDLKVIIPDIHKA